MKNEHYDDVINEEVENKEVVGKENVSPLLEYTRKMFSHGNCFLPKPETEMAKFILSRDYKRAGRKVRTPKFVASFSKYDVAMFRRAFKAEELILDLGYPKYQEHDSIRVLFTEKGIAYRYEDEDIKFFIEYKSITDVDYEGDDVVITSDGKEYRLHLGDDAEDEGYTSNLYMLIMDVVDKIRNE